MKRYISILIIIVCYGFVTNAQSIRSFWTPVYQPVDSLILLLEQTKGYEKAPARQKWIQELYNIASEHPHRRVFQWRALFWDARNQKAVGKRDQAYKLLVKADSLVNREEYPYDYRRIHELKKIWQYKEEKNVFQNYKTRLEQISYYQSVGDWILQADVYLDIGNILAQLGESGQALKNFEKAERYYRKGGGKMQAVKTKLNIANCYFALGKKEKAIKLLQRLETDSITRQDTSFHINLLLSLTRYLPIHEDLLYQKYVMKMHRLASCYLDPELQAKSEINLAAYYLSKKEHGKSLELYRNSLYYADSCQDVFALLPCLAGVAANFVNIHQWDSAAIYLNTYNYYRDSLEQISHVADIKQMEWLTTIKGYERQIQTEKEKAHTRQLIILLISAFLLLVFGGFYYVLWNKRQKERIKKQLKETENRELSTRLENERLLNRQRQMEIEAQNRQLTLDTMILSEKTAALKAVQEQISIAKEQKEIHSTVAKEVSIQIKMHLEDELNWKSFQQAFEKVCPGFFTRLKQLYPSLTGYELRLCAFIRTGTESKQIANMLNIQPESIKKARQRLRKKLPLDANQSLENFLRGHDIQ